MGVDVGVIVDDDVAVAVVVCRSTTGAGDRLVTES